ncbi:MAG: hypothetical protein NE327_19215 [Lentisphaeraceae bacterium]|nr:hypothetical protein [Lentisphaeraceae bacterium]
MKYFLYIIGLLIGSYILFLSVHKTRNTYRCLECLSSKSVYQWHIGEWNRSLDITSQDVVLKESYFMKKFLTESHQHKWTYSQGSPYLIIGGQRGCAIGSGRHQTQFGREYERSEEFRGFINALYDGGELSESEIFELALNTEMSDGMSNLELELFDKYFGELPPCSK